MEAIAPPSEILEKPKRRRRWWIGIVFAFLGIVVVMAVDFLAQPAPIPYAFLKGAKLDGSDEFIGPGLAHRMMHVRSNRSIVNQPYAILRPRVEAELTGIGFSVVDRRAENVLIRNFSNGAFVVLIDTGNSTLVHWSIVRPYTILDRSRIWLKSLFPSNAKQREEAGETK